MVKQNTHVVTGQCSSASVTDDLSDGDATTVMMFTRELDKIGLD
jgi:hypothetical protein